MIPTLPDRVADAVAQAEKTYKVKEIADLCGVTVQAVYDWRKKKTINLKGETLVELAEVSGLNARWIINGKGNRESGYSLSADEQLIVEAFRLRGNEMRGEMLRSAKNLLDDHKANSSKAA